MSDNQPPIAHLVNRRTQREQQRVLRANSWALATLHSLHRRSTIVLPRRNVLVNNPAAIRAVLAASNWDRAATGGVGALLEQHLPGAAVFNQPANSTRTVRNQGRAYLNTIISNTYSPAEKIHNQLADGTPLDLAPETLSVAGSLAAAILGLSLPAGQLENFGRTLDATVAVHLKKLLPQTPGIRSAIRTANRFSLSPVELINLATNPNGLFAHLTYHNVPHEQALGATIAFALAAVPTTYASTTRIAHIVARSHLYPHLTADPQLLTTLIHHVAPTSILPRTTKTPTQVHDRTVNEGTRLVLAVMNAPAEEHLAFGHGPTRCIGEHVATRTIHALITPVLSHSPHIVSWHPAHTSALPALDRIQLQATS